jgi:hypothetical protein
MAALDFHIVGIGGWITNKNLVAHNVHISSTFANYITSLCPNREKKQEKTSILVGNSPKNSGRKE